MFNPGMVIKIRENKDYGENTYSNLTGKIGWLHGNEAKIVLDTKSSLYIENHNSEKNEYYTTMPLISIKNLTTIKFIFGDTE